MSGPSDLAGGFLPPGGLPSPSPSTASSTRPGSVLPHPRGKALMPGSSKEDLVRRYVEEKLMQTSRRYVKKFGQASPGDDVVGYKSFSEVCKDLDSVVNVLWLSGTREYTSQCCMRFITTFTNGVTASLQIPFLLKLASDFTQYVRSFPPAPKTTFDLLRKLDHCFSSLLSGKDIDTGEPLPGFENGLRAGMTTTDMVRCRSLVEQTRVLMVEVMSSGAEEEDDDDEDTEMETGTETETEAESGYGSTARWDIDEDDRLHLDAARIYERTIVQLGERLGDPLEVRNMSED